MLKKEENPLPIPQHSKLFIYLYLHVEEGNPLPIPQFCAIEQLDTEELNGHLMLDTEELNGHLMLDTEELNGHLMLDTEELNGHLINSCLFCFLFD
jgi:uncharacterized protein YuzE